jgi:hypothetical protein
MKKNSLVSQQFGLQVIQKYPVGLYILRSQSERGFIGKYCVQNLKKSVISNYNCIRVKVGSIFVEEVILFINNTTKSLQYITLFLRYF